MNRRAGEADSEFLLREAAAGDAVALQSLLTPHRERLRRMVALRLSSWLAARIDPSEVVREAFLEAEARLGAYVRDRPMAFYPWLHRLAGERLEAIRRRLTPTEADQPLPESSETSAATAVTEARGGEGRPAHEAGPASSASSGLEERRRWTRAALASLPPSDREILVLHYLEDLDFSDISAILGIDSRTLKKRHLLSLRRMSKRPGGPGGEPGGGR